MIYALIIVCNTMSIKKDCILLSDKWGPYHTIEQCLDRVDRMKTDTLERLPEYELENSQCRTEPGQTFGTIEYPSSSSGA